MRAGSFTPGSLSTPDETSTAAAPVRRTASATLPACRPPESNHGSGHSVPVSSRQSKLTALPPGSGEPFGGLASNSNRSAAPKYWLAFSTSAGSAMEAAFHTGRPKLAFTSATRSGVSFP